MDKAIQSSLSIQSGSLVGQSITREYPLLETYSVFSLDIGMTDGGSVRARSWNKKGVAEFGSFPVGIYAEEGGVRLYDLEALKTFWTRARDNFQGASLSEMAARHNILVSTSWGADLVALKKEGNSFVPLIAVNYPTTNDNPDYRGWFSRVDAAFWHKHAGGAAQGAYQWPCQLAFMEERCGRDLWKEIAAVVPVSDYRTYLLTGQTGHDPVMAQSQGFMTMLKEGSVCEMLKKFGLSPELEGKLFPWPLLPQGALVKTGKLWVAPDSHDSPWAREIGFSMGVNAVVWTGSWVGVAILNSSQVAPNSETLGSGASFEGRAVQKNTLMGGALYGELLVQAGFGTREKRAYREAAEAAILVDPRKIPDLDMKKLSSYGATQAEDAARYMLQACSGDRAGAVAAFLRTVAKAVSTDLKALGENLKQPVQSIGIVGGWARNAAFVRFLQELGHEVVIPPNAAGGAPVGITAEGINRVAGMEGNNIPLQDILGQLPQD